MSLAEIIRRILTSTSRFVDFGSLPAFVGIWELASTPARRNTLQQAYAQFVQLYTADLSLPGPYLHARLTDAIDPSKEATIAVGDVGHYVAFYFPASKSLSDGKRAYTNIMITIARSDGWYFLSPGSMGNNSTPIIGKELVPGALAPVKWAEIFTDRAPYQRFTRFWKAVPPTSDYVALGFVAMQGSSVNALPAQPPASLADQFRAVHKLALTGASKGATLSTQTLSGQKFFAVDYRYWLADREVPVKGDCFVLDPKMAIKDWQGW